MRVKKYKAAINFCLGEALVLEGDVIYLEQINPVGGFYRPQVWNEKRELLGSIDKDKYYDFEKMLIVSETK